MVNQLLTKFGALLPEDVFTHTKGLWYYCGACHDFLTAVFNKQKANTIAFHYDRVVGDRRHFLEQ